MKNSFSSASSSSRNPKVLYLSSEGTRPAARNFQTNSPKVSNCPSEGFGLIVRRHGLNVSSVCHRSLSFLCRQARLRISSPIAMDTCVLHHTSNIKHLTSLPAFLRFSQRERPFPFFNMSIQLFHRYGVSYVIYRPYLNLSV